ncbi:hypothetical protein [Streptococcus suis]
MPLQFKESGTGVYTINYGSLIKELLKMEIFHDRNIQQLYLDQWQAVLKQAEQEDLDNLLPYYSSYGINDQYFTYQFFLGDQEYHLHFNISKLLHSPELATIPSDEISIKDFIKSDILWKEPADGKKSLSFGKPIIIIPLSIGTYNHIVIDGNHRIQEAIAKSNVSITFQHVDTLTLLNSNIFFTSFDQLFYAFLCELKLMALEEHSDDVSLLKQSYLQYRYRVFEDVPPTSQSLPFLLKCIRKILHAFSWSKR